MKKQVKSNNAKNVNAKNVKKTSTKKTAKKPHVEIAETKPEEIDEIKIANVGEICEIENEEIAETKPEENEIQIPAKDRKAYAREYYKLHADKIRESSKLSHAKAAAKRKAACAAVKEICGKLEKLVLKSKNAEIKNLVEDLAQAVVDLR